MEAFLNSPEADVIREGAYDVLPETPVFGAHPSALGTRCCFVARRALQCCKTMHTLRHSVRVTFASACGAHSARAQYLLTSSAADVASSVQPLWTAHVALICRWACLFCLGGHFDAAHPT